MEFSLIDLDALVNEHCAEILWGDQNDSPDHDLREDVMNDDENGNANHASVNIVDNIPSEMVNDDRMLSEEIRVVLGLGPEIDDVLKTIREDLEATEMDVFGFNNSIGDNVIENRVNLNDPCEVFPYEPGYGGGLYGEILDENRDAIMNGSCNEFLNGIHKEEEEEEVGFDPSDRKRLGIRVLDCIILNGPRGESNDDESRNAGEFMDDLSLNNRIIGINEIDGGLPSVNEYNLNDDEEDDMLGMTLRQFELGLREVRSDFIEGMDEDHFIVETLDAMEQDVVDAEVADPVNTNYSVQVAINELENSQDNNLLMMVVDEVEEQVLNDMIHMCKDDAENMDFVDDFIEQITDDSHEQISTPNDLIPSEPDSTFDGEFNSSDYLDDINEFDLYPVSLF